MIREYASGLSRKAKIIIIVITSIVVVGIISGAILGATLGKSSNPSPSPVPSSVPSSVPDGEPAQDFPLIIGLNGTYFIKRDDKYLSHTAGDLVEDAPLYDPHDQGWIIREVKNGTYTIQNKHNNLYMTGFVLDPYLGDSTQTRSVPHVMIELHERHADPENSQHWELVGSLDEMYIRIEEYGMSSRSHSYVGFPLLSQTAALVQNGTIFSIEEYDSTLEPSHHDPSDDDLEKDKNPSGWMVSSNRIRQIIHKHLGLALMARPDDSVGLFDNYNLGEQSWNIKRIQHNGEYPNRYPYIFRIQNFDNGLYLTIDDDNNRVFMSTFQNSTKFNNQTWWIRTSSVRGVEGFQTGVSGKYLFIDDSDGWTLKLHDLDTGWNSWKMPVIV